MSIQDVFYTVATIFAVMGVVVFIGLGVGAFLLYRKLKQLEKMVSHKSAALGNIIERIPAFMTSKGVLTLLPLIPTAIGWIMKKKNKRG